MLDELARKAAFRDNPMLEGFLGTALQDLQLSENEEAYMEKRNARDVGTIYTTPDATFVAAQRECEAFRGASRDILADIQWPDLQSLGSDLYLERVGHGAGFRDRSYDDDRDVSDDIGERLSAAVSPRGTLEMYVGDDGAAWICGAESAA